MEPGCGVKLDSVDHLERNLAALHKKLQDDFAQLEKVQRKVRALSMDWEKAHKQLTTEQEKVAELEAQIKHLNAKREETLATIQADAAQALARVQEGENLEEMLRAKIAPLEEKVAAAHREAAESAKKLEKNGWEAELVLEAAAVRELAREELQEVDREELAQQQKRKTTLQGKEVEQLANR